MGSQNVPQHVPKKNNKKHLTNNGLHISTHIGLVGLPYNIGDNIRKIIKYIFLKIILLLPLKMPL
jgi:hypothetical protein